MLILAGVSINAIVGENGVLSRAQYTSFMSEMAAVEEAVQLWKAGELMESKGQSNTAIPANGLCKVNDLTGAERLVGEIGYYRTWGIGNAMPDMNIFSSAVDFNKKFEGEFIFYPAGVQDLYYLNTEALDLDEDKVYLIDAATSIVYSTTGITLNGVRCYSTYMAKAVMGNNIAPIFAAAEMSGGGDDIIYAGETYLKDKNGNYIDENGNIVSEENKVLNPNGFQIISHYSSNNIFKLYNDGTLYGKGVKGIQLNSSEEEMEEINPYVWNEFTVPENVKKAGIKKIIPGGGTVYVIDNAEDLWAWGSNTTNKLGLTQEQQVEYTGREAVKLNIGNGKKVKKVYTGPSDTTFLIVEDELTKEKFVYAAGNNSNGALGLGHKNEVSEFTQVNVTNVENIKKILPNNYATLIWYNDNTFYAVGTNRGGYLFSTGEKKSDYLETFTQIYNGVIGTDVDQDIQDILFPSTSVMILKTDGTIWQTGYLYGDGSGGGGDLSTKYAIYEFAQFPTTFGSNVTGIYQVGGARLITRTNDSGELEVWGTPGNGNNLGLGEETYNSTKYWQITIPDELKNEEIKEIFTTSINVYYLSNTGKVYVSGVASTSGLNLTSGKVNGIVYSGLDNIETMYSIDLIEISDKNGYSASPLCFTGKDGKIYTTGNSTIVFRDNILQKNWKEVATNVKYFDASGAGYVDKYNNLYIAGSDSRTLGLGADSEISKSINNYILHPDTSIQGRVAEVKFATGITMVRTTDNELWATGLYEYAGTSYYPGWAEAENKTTFVKILDNIRYFDFNGYNSVAISTDNIVYGWGANYNGLVWHSTVGSSIPIAFELPADVGGVNNVKNIKVRGNHRANLITETGELFCSGTWTSGSYDGGHTSTSYFSKYTYNINLNTDEKIIETAFLGGTSSLILTSEGRLFGFGPANRLGIGSTSAGNVETQLITGISNVSQIVVGNGFLIAIKNDGTVWGTGTNTYGILGRWIGIDRNSPNSRYKTAFEWVECPELEI